MTWGTHRDPVYSSVHSSNQFIGAHAIKNIHHPNTHYAFLKAHNLAVYAAFTNRQSVSVMGDGGVRYVY